MMTDDETTNLPQPTDLDTILATMRHRGAAAILATSEMDTEELTRLHYQLKDLHSLTMETAKLVREGIVERMMDLGIEEIQVDGTRRLYIGTERDTLPINNEAIAHGLLEAGGVVALAQCLASRPWKHGACREPLGDEWPNLFEVVPRTVIKEGKPTKAQRKLLEADDKFTR